MKTAVPRPAKANGLTAGKSPHALPSDEALDLIAVIFAALADPIRLKLIHTLMAGEQSVNSLVEATAGAQSNVSRHLAKLMSAGLLYRRREGTRIIYGIADSSIYDLCDQVCGLLEKRLAKQAKVVIHASRPLRSA